jgi:acetyl esterase/lipase
MRTLHLLFITCVTLSLSFTACKKDNDNGNVQPETKNPAREEMNVAYGGHERQKMDVYFPEGYNSSTPVVFLIHGGGFVAGSKEEFTPRAQAFLGEGFIVVNISHRLIDTTGLLTLPPVHMASAIKITDELADVHAAVTKYMSLAAEWKAGTGRMYMAGHSAGAILSMLYTQGDQNDDKHIRACGNWAGLTDLSIPSDSAVNSVDPRIKELLYRATGFEVSVANNLAFMAISPYWVANINDGRPTISIYPENNTVLNVPGEAAWGLSTTQSYHLLLGNKGVDQRLSIYMGNDHGFSPSGSWEKLIDETAEFFNKN